jgi:hypothetical protein
MVTEAAKALGERKRHSKPHADSVIPRENREATRDDVGLARAGM